MSYRARSCRQCMSCSTNIAAGEGTTPRCERGHGLSVAIRQELGYFVCEENSDSWLTAFEVDKCTAALQDEDKLFHYYLASEDEIWGAAQEWLDSLPRCNKRPNKPAHMQAIKTGFVAPRTQPVQRSVRFIKDEVCERFADKCFDYVKREYEEETEPVFDHSAGFSDYDIKLMNGWTKIWSKTEKQMIWVREAVGA